jgi:hypothetical protein
MRLAFIISPLAAAKPPHYTFHVITVEKTNTDLRITIPKDAVPPKQLNDFLDWLRLEEIVQRSRLTEEDADRIANDIKAQWWAANKDRFIPPEER